MLKRTVVITKLLIIGTLAGIVLSISISTGIRLGAPRAPKLNAESAILIDAWDGLVLYEKNSDKRLPPASTVKVMTAIIAVENYDPEKPMTVSRDIFKIEPTVAGLKVGEQYRLESLLAAILIKSGNDAAMAIAVNVAGDEESFVALMNAKARSIGMENTRFANASGLPSKKAQYSTAADLARMMLYASRYPQIVDLCSKAQMTIGSIEGREIELKTHNRLLIKRDTAPWGKTGYTRKARRTFVGTNPSYNRRRIIFAFMKSDDIWRDMAKLNVYGLAKVHRRHQSPSFKITKYFKELFAPRPLYMRP